MSEAIAFIAGLFAMMVVWFINDNSPRTSLYRRGFEDGYRKAMKDYGRKEGDEAYQKGYDKGYADKTNNDEVGKELAKDVYQRGLEDGRNETWEAARKVAFNADNGGLSIEDLEKAFDCLVPQQVFKKYTAQQTIDKLKAYEEQEADDEIKVGDEVDWSGDKFIVTRIFQPYDKAEECDGVDMDGCVYHDVLISGLTKTGRHFDIADMLKGINWT